MIDKSTIKNHVALFGVPRSGTTWLGQIINSSPKVVYRYQPLFSYEFKDRLSEKSTEEDIKKFHEDILNAKSDFVTQSINTSGNFIKPFTKNEPNTLVWKEVRYINILENIMTNSNLKVIALTRHPCAVINSWVKLPKEFKEEWDLYDEWRLASKKNLGKKENYFGYEKWKEALRIFANCRDEYPGRTHIIRYEDLVDNTRKCVGEIFEFLDIDVGEQTEEFLAQSKSETDDDPYGVARKDQDTRKWENELDPQIKRMILDDLKTFKLAKEFGYE